jgi:hypothetical protein
MPFRILWSVFAGRAESTLHLDSREDKASYESPHLAARFVVVADIGRVRIRLARLRHLCISSVGCTSDTRYRYLDLPALHSMPTPISSVCFVLR